VTAAFLRYSATTARLVLASVAVALLVAVPGVQASGGNETARSTARDERYVAECGSCHVAYPPRLLPAASWRQVMGSLERHFGSDASIEPALAQDIAAFLERNAGAPQRLGADPATPRVSATQWFVRKHAKVPEAAWQRPAIGRASNCGACHVEAAAGDFRKRHLDIPR
jgi:cytochrome c553